MSRYENKDWLEREYVEENRSVKNIAKDFDTGYGTIFYYVKKYGLKKDKKYKDKKWLKEKYIDEDKNIYEIADICNVTGATIYQNLKDKDIEIKSNSKEQHYRWNEHKETEWYKTKEGEKWRKQVFERDNYTCQLCGEEGGNLNAHHIIPKKDDRELKNSISNGITVCEFCHGLLHYDRGDETEANLLFENSRKNNPLKTCRY